MEDILARTASTQERWVSDTEAYLPKAFKRIKRHGKMHNHSLEDYGFYGTKRTPRIYRQAGRVLFPSRFSLFPLESCRSSQTHPLSFISPAGDGLDSRRRVVFIQHKKYSLPRSGQQASSWRFFWRADPGT
jgi:hypothetical protein